jgi:hypothetical protein
MKELKIEKAENGYVVNMMNWTGEKRVFKSFRKLVGFMRAYFEEKKKGEKDEVLPDQFSTEKKKEEQKI